MIRVVSRTPDTTESVAALLAECVRPGVWIALIGDLGAGKTTFAKGFAVGLQIERIVTSPTYALVQIYEGPRMVMGHADLYRLEPGANIDDLGLNEIVEEGVALVEWPKGFYDEIGENLIEVIISANSEDRVLEFRAVGDTAHEILAQFEPRLA